MTNFLIAQNWQNFLKFEKKWENGILQCLKMP